MIVRLILVRPIRAIRNAFLFAALLGFGCFVPSNSPTIRVEYSPSEDLACSLPPGSPIKEQWKAELLSRQFEFVRLWQSEGPKLLAATKAISGRDFPLEEITALAHALPSECAIICPCWSYKRQSF